MDSMSKAFCRTTKQPEVEDDDNNVDDLVERKGLIVKRKYTPQPKYLKPAEQPIKLLVDEINFRRSRFHNNNHGELVMNLEFMESLLERVENLENAIKYLPGSPLVEEAKANFDKNKNLL
jgi:hypothetical protein